MYYLGLCLTRICNQSCYYCSVFVDTPIVNDTDISYLKYVLDSMPPGSAVEMTGGEIGQIKNIDEVFKTIYNHKNIDKIMAMSNGLLRYKGVDWLDKVEYYEHLVWNIRGLDIKKFYDMPFYNKGQTVIVATEMTVTSLLENWDFYKQSSLMKENIYIKLMNKKTHDIERYADKALKLFQLMKDKKQIKMAESFKDRSLYIAQKQLCSFNSPYPYVDFESKELGHCAIPFNKAKRVEFTPNNLQLQLKGELFTDCNYCNQCYTFDDGNDKIYYILNCKKGNYMNRSYKDAN